MRNRYVPWMLGMPILFSMCICCANVANGKDETKIELNIRTFPDNHELSSWDKTVTLWDTKDKVVIPLEKKAKLFKQVAPWIKRVLANDFCPKNSDEVVMFLVREPEIGQVYLLSYQAKGYQVKIIDTCMTLYILFRQDTISQVPTNAVISTWQKYIHLFMKQAERFDTPAKFWVTTTSTETFMNPLYASEPLGKTGVEFWWDKSVYKLINGEFRVGIWKRIDGEHPADSTFGKRNRYDHLENP